MKRNAPGAAGATATVAGKQGAGAVQCADSATGMATGGGVGVGCLLLCACDCVLCAAMVFSAVCSRKFAVCGLWFVLLFVRTTSLYFF